MLAGRGSALPESLCVVCRLPELEARCQSMCLRQPMSKRYLGNQQWMCLRMLCLGLLHSRFHLPEKYRSTFLGQLRKQSVLLLLLLLLQRKRRLPVFLLS